MNKLRQLGNINAHEIDQVLAVGAEIPSVTSEMLFKYLKENRGFIATIEKAVKEALAVCKEKF